MNDRFASRITFWKMSGSGNDFVVVDNRAGLIPAAAAAEFARLVCRRRLAIGADGVVLIEHADEPVDFAWRYLNADGSDGEMCGNGAICGARFAYENRIAPARCAFTTPSGLVRAEVEPENGRVRLAMVEPGPVSAEIRLEAAGRKLRLHAVVVGVPHVVVLTDDVDAFAPGAELIALGRAVRHHPAFAPAGTNVNVVAVRGRHALRMRTYERGVEDETLACGTGAAASATVAMALGLVAPPVEVVVSSGRTLTVDFAWDGVRATGVTLSGEARIVAVGEVGPEALAP